MHDSPLTGSLKPFSRDETRGGNALWRIGAVLVEPYACRILLQERIAGRKLQGALGIESVADHAAGGLSAGANGANDSPGMLLGARSEEVANPLADSGRLAYTTSRGMDDIVE